MKKIISFLCLAVFTFSLFSGCGPKAAEEELPEEEITYKDMEGVEFIYLSGWEKELFPDEGFSLAGDAAILRIKQVNENFNCKFTVQHGGLTELTNALAIAEDIPITIDMMDAFSVYKSGYFAPYEQITTMDINDESLWGTKNFLQYRMFDGKNRFGMIPNQWHSTPQFAGCLLVNNELLRTLGITKTPYEMIENKEWNWENYKELLKNCTVTEGEQAICGMGYDGGGESDAIFGKTVCLSNNANILDVKEENGVISYEFGLTSPAAYAALDYVSSLINLGYAKKLGSEDFSTSKTPFLLCESWIGTLYSDGSDTGLPADTLKDYGFLYFPHGPNAEPGTISSYVHRYRRLVYLIGVSAHDFDDIGLILNAMFQPLAEDKTLGWEYYSKKNVFHHEKDYENFLLMIDKMRYDYSTFLGSTNTSLATAITSTYKGKKTPAEAMTAIADKIKAAVDKSFEE